MASGDVTPRPPARVILELDATNPGPWPNDVEVFRDALFVYAAVMENIGHPGTDMVGINGARRTAERAREVAEMVTKAYNDVLDARRPKKGR